MALGGGGGDNESVSIPIYLNGGCLIGAFDIHKVIIIKTQPKTKWNKK